MVSSNTSPPPPDTTRVPSGDPSVTEGMFSPLRFQGYDGSYGWNSSRAPYNYQDAAGVNRSDPWNTAYEWYRYSDRVGSGGGTNPPFSSGSSGRLMNSITSEDGQQSRILRGFIRRAEYDTTDPLSTGRLYFMFNPTIISRDYVSYLDQGSLDPFNTVFQSNNLVAPPSMMNFTFELFFDRQDEAQVSGNPGVLVDMEYFDMVVRNVIPDPEQQAMPDNGVMMVNPRDITVVFSPEITVQGRPLNASVVFEKFTHRMVPTRMRIQLTMRVVYWGPMREATTYSSPAQETTATQTVGWASTAAANTNITYVDLVNQSTGATVREIISLNAGFTQAASAGVGGVGGANSSALDFAIAQATAATTQYDANRRNQLWAFADCSSLVWGGYAGVGQATALGWPAGNTTSGESIGKGVSIPSTAVMQTGFLSSTAVQKIWGYAGETDKTAGCKKMARGDLLLRIKGNNLGDNHVAFVSAVTDSYIEVFHAMSESLDVGYTTYYFPVDFKYTHGVRPNTLGGQGVVNQNNNISAF